MNGIPGAGWESGIGVGLWYLSSSLWGPQGDTDTATGREREDEDGYFWLLTSLVFSRFDNPCMQSIILYAVNHPVCSQSSCMQSVILYVASHPVCSQSSCM